MAKPTDQYVRRRFMRMFATATPEWQDATIDSLEGLRMARSDEPEVPEFEDAETEPKAAEQREFSNPGTALLLGESA